MALHFRSALSGRAVIAAALPALLGVTTARAQFAENFDAVVAPALPSSWTTASFGFSWTTTTQTPHSPPNCAAATTLAQVSEAYLDSPVISIGDTTHLVRFRHRFQLEGDGGVLRGLPAGFGFDGGVLEIAIGGADYQDIIAAGGEFLAGAYTLPISNQFGSLISDRQAWSGDSGGYIATSIRLPPSTINSMFRLRFRLSSDANNGGGVWAIDRIDVVDECVLNDIEAPTVVCVESFSQPGRFDLCDDPRLAIGSMASTITDNCPNPLVVTQDPPVGTLVPPGSTLVTVTATDLAGNVGQCTTTLTVLDPAAGQCGICCGPAYVQAILMSFGTLGVGKLSRRRSRPLGARC